MSEWKPIETAPKGGTTILVFISGKGEQGQFRDDVLAARWSEWGGGIWSARGHNLMTESSWITHWQPLPPPPEEK